MRCTGTVLALAVVCLSTTLGCEASAVDDEDPIPPDDVGTLETPGGAFVDIQCGGKHKRHGFASFTDRGAKFTRSGSTDTFRHLDTSCNRVEVDTNDPYKSGTHTFEGEVRSATSADRAWSRSSTPRPAAR
jgi:hypothetical protein